MQNIEFSRNFIEKANSSNYILSIRIESNGFCFFVFDILQKKFIFFKNVLFDFSQHLSATNQIKNNIDSDSIFNFPFRKVNIIYCGQSYTLLPSAFYDADKKEDLLKFNQALIDEDIVKSSLIKGTDIINIFSFPKLYFDFFQQKFPNAFIHHQASLLVFDAVKKTDSSKQFHIDVYPDFFYATVVENTHLLLSNTYSYTNLNEFVYHIINLYDKLELNQQETKLYFSGEIEKEGKEINILKDYIQNIHFAEQPDCSVIPDFQTISSHKMSKILVSCEL